MTQQLVLNPRLVPRSWLVGLLDLQEETIDLYDDDYEREEDIGRVRVRRTQNNDKHARESICRIC